MEEDTDMVEQDNNGCSEYANKYIFEIRHLADMIECKDNAAFVSSLKEDFGKLGLFSQAQPISFALCMRFEHLLKIRKPYEIISA